MLANGGSPGLGDCYAGSSRRAGDRGRHGEAMTREDRARVRERRSDPGTVGPEPITSRIVTGTSEIAMVVSRAAAARAQPGGRP